MKWKKTVSAGLTGLMIFSIAVPVFGAAAEEPPAADTEAADAGTEKSFFYLDSRNGQDQNDGLTAETALQSVSALLEKLPEQAEGQEVFLMLCPGTVLEKEEEKLLAEKKVTAVLQISAEEKASAESPASVGSEGSPDIQVQTTTPGETSAPATTDDVSPIPLQGTQENGESGVSEEQQVLLLQKNLREAAEQMMQPEVLMAPAVSLAENPESDAAAALQSENMISVPEMSEPVMAFAAVSLEQPEMTALQAEIPATAETPQIMEVPQLTAEVPQIMAEVPQAAAETPQIMEVPQAAAETPQIMAEVPQTAAETPQIMAEVPQAAAETPQMTTQAPAGTERMLLSLPGRDLVGTGTTQTSGQTAPSETSASSAAAAPGTQNPSVTPAVNGKRTAPVDTADRQPWMPYMLSAVLSGAAWLALNKKNLDQKRKDKNSVYAEELEAFRRACTE